MATPTPNYVVVKGRLGTQPVSPEDDHSHAFLYRYPLTTDGSDASRVDVLMATPRISVLDFFYPRAGLVQSSGGEEKSEQDSLDRQKKTRDLFLLSFGAVQALPPADKWSFYQIAGIHGLPHVPYDSDPSEWDPKGPENRWGGYCQHGTPLFPTWHRPYTMLMEQSIIRQAQIIAKSLSDSQEGQDALQIASTLRFPYWDWASQSSRLLGIPDIFLSTRAPLLYAWKSFSTTSIPNPLKAFVLPVSLGEPFCSSDVGNPTAKPNYVVPTEGAPFTPQHYPTVRHVDAAYLSRNDTLNVFFIRSANGFLVEGVRATFQHNQWLPFSNHFWSEETHGDGSSYGHYASIELVHDFLHDVVGGPGGHMAYPEVAAFDPIFFFHHVNVDRLVALWQYCYPDAWIPTDQSFPEGTYTVEVDSKATASTDLTPFRRSNEKNHFVTSDDVRVVDADCGFTYPEILQARREGWEPAKMLGYVRNLYKPPEDFENRWILVADRIVKRAFNGPFKIRVFLDNPHANADTPTTIPNYAGEMLIFARASNVQCATCDNRNFMRSTLDLTKTMARLGIATSASVDDNGKVVPNPLSAGGAITTVFANLLNQQLDPLSALGCESKLPKMSLYYQQGIVQDNINEYLVDDNINTSPRSWK